MFFISFFTIFWCCVVSDILREKVVSNEARKNCVDEESLRCLKE